MYLPVIPVLPLCDFNVDHLNLFSFQHTLSLRPCLCPCACVCLRAHSCVDCGRSWCEHKCHGCISLKYWTEHLSSVLAVGLFYFKTLDSKQTSLCIVVRVNTSHSSSVTIAPSNLHIQKLIFAQLVMYTSLMNLKVLQ